MCREVGSPGFVQGEREELYTWRGKGWEWRHLPEGSGSGAVLGGAKPDMHRRKAEAGLGLGGTGEFPGGLPAMWGELKQGWRGGYPRGEAGRAEEATNTQAKFRGSSLKPRGSR